MHHSLKINFHVGPKKSQVHQNKCLRLLMEIVMMKIMMVGKNVNVAKGQGQKNLLVQIF